MPAEVSVLLADPARLTAFRDGIRLPGRVLRFATINLASVLDTIKASRPGLVAIDGVFAQRLEGQAFVDRVRKLGIPNLEIRLVARVGGNWTTTALPGAPGMPPSIPKMIDVKASGINTRRAPRLVVLNEMHAMVESNNRAGIVDMSVQGAQLLSTPQIRPNQVLKIQLPDNDTVLRLTAHVAWSRFERPPHVNDAYYRAGMEFTDASAQALEEYCKRYCSDDPIPYRGT